MILLSFLTRSDGFLTPPAFRSELGGGGTAMAAKILKYAALPAAVVGLGSFRIYSMSEKPTNLISLKELSIYSPDHSGVQFVEEQSGLVQSGLEAVRVGLQPYVRGIQNGFTSVKVGITSTYQAGEDTYHFLRDPPPGFLPRVGVITVSGLGGLILARKGSRLKKIVVPLGLATVGTAVCYPTQTVGVLKITGKKVYNVSSYVASLFQSKPKAEGAMPAGNMESAAPVKIPDPVSNTPESKLVPAEEVISLSEAVPAAASPVAVPDVEPPSTVETAPETIPVDSAPEPTSSTQMIPDAYLTPLDVPATTSSPPTEEIKLLTEEPVSDAPSPANQTTTEEVPPPVLETTLPSPIVEIPPLSESPVQEAIVEPTAAKSRFVPDPALLDHGQSNPEDADLYSTRS
ncbi:MICOS complex subunit MIC27 [Paramisgurnus dabryanus]|uniref:MICOS complex subunit MIC27 n=1 Tax=Paramisgurnus dabryanus TaxID=90735 RepID=UPI003CCFD7F9